MKHVIFALALFTVCAILAGCGYSDGLTPEQRVEQNSQKVSLVAVAPDGTNLWVYDGANMVFFSSSGTQRQVYCGKSCTRQEFVPSAVPDQRKDNELIFISPPNRQANLR